MDQLTIGHITLDDTVSMEGPYYFLYYWDDRFSNETDLKLKVLVHEDIVREQAEKRGKLNARVDYYSSVDSDTITYEYFSESPDKETREAFDEFVQELAAEMLNLHLIQENEKLRYELVKKQVVTFQSRINTMHEGKQYCIQGKTYKKQVS